MNAKVLIIVIYFVINFKSCQGAEYKHYFLVDVHPVTRDQLKYLKSLDSQKYMDIIFCDKPTKLGVPIQVIVSPVDLAMFRERAEHFNLDYTVLITDVQGAFNNQLTINYQSLRPDTYSFEHFHQLKDIYQWLVDLTLNKTQSVNQYSIGKSAEGRDINVVNINLTPTVSKHKVIVEGGIHGHEWAAIVFVTYLINELVHSEQSSDYGWESLAKNYDWYLIPVLNPDGYDYTHKTDRLWRKNRGTKSVNLNRNFDSSFGVFGCSNDTNNEEYNGPGPFSEPETKALLSFISPMRKDVKYYFAIHSYGQRIIIPYEDRVQHLENFGEMESYSRQAIRKLYLHDKVKYATGTLYDIMGTRMSGTSTSWAKKQMKIKYVYTIQVRDTGAYGYALPCDQLLPMCKDTKSIIYELMTAKPRYVRALFADDANINTVYIPFVLLSFMIALK